MPTASLLCLSTNFMLFILSTSGHTSNSDGCNEYVCGSVVSKCLITQSCQCKLTDCYCCKDCLHCLGELYIECCSCLDMCPKRNETLSALAPKSQIGDFDGVPELFDTLTAEDDEEQWTIMRFPMRAALKQQFAGIKASGGGVGDSLDRRALKQKSSAPATVNCTVIYLNNCITSRKCTQYCESMGASSYRWFHDGCCECVGAHCLNYGLNESRCSECPLDEDDDADGEFRIGDVDDEDDEGQSVRDSEKVTEMDEYAENEDEILWDYGEDEINYN